jgi:hypothetical protein
MRLHIPVPADAFSIKNSAELNNELPEILSLY